MGLTRMVMLMIYDIAGAGCRNGKQSINWARRKMLESCSCDMLGGGWIILTVVGGRNGRGGWGGDVRRRVGGAEGMEP